MASLSPQKLYYPPPPPLPVVPSSVWTWNVSRHFGHENAAFVNDSVRVLLIQVFMQVMLYINSPEKNGLFASEFVILVTFLGLGICFYWLVFRRLLTIA